MKIRMGKMKNSIFQNTEIIRYSFSFIDKRDKKVLTLISVIQIFLGFLDLLGVAAIGLVASLSITGVKSQDPGSRVAFVLRTFHLTDLGLQTQVALIASIAAVALIAKTLTSMYFGKRILYFLSRRASVVSSGLISKLLSQDLLTIQKKSSQETLYAVTSGVQAMMVSVVGTLINVTSDVFLLLILSAGLFLIDPILFIMTLFIFGAVSLVLYLSVHIRVNQLGNASTDLMIKSNESILEVITGYREIFVKNRRHYYQKKIANSRLALSNVGAELAFIPNISKYLIEITLVVAALLISAVQFLLGDAVHAISAMSIFLAAGSRIAPAILRIQSGALSIKSAGGPIGQVRSLTSNFQEFENLIPIEKDLDSEHHGFIASVQLRGVTFSYPGQSGTSIKPTSITISPGEIIALVGPSGAGKTTLADLILGIISPDSGEVLVSGVSPSLAIEKWPGAIGYVPQDVQIINGTVLENVAMGYSEGDQDLELVKDALESSQLGFLAENLHSYVGERGNKISGGQRQRLGIARALYTKPKLLVLDEATSSLDGQTESEISSALTNLRGQVTVILIAHRLSTIMNSDKVVYLSDGKIEAIGSFEQVRREIEDFDNQAKLMGM
jgi:ATP-binding cassette, subfamily B, bacterial PglK